jgi:hypothetical protein
MTQLTSWYLVDKGVSGSKILFWLVGVFNIPLTGVLPALPGVTT